MIPRQMAWNDCRYVACIEIGLIENNNVFLTICDDVGG